MTDRPLLKLTDVHKSYKAPEGPELAVLKGVSLTVNQNDSLSIVGPSGCGKSTLLNLIGTLDRPDSGTVAVNGNDIHALNERDAASFRNNQIGFIFQLHHLLPQCTVLDNVLMPALAAGTSARSETIARAEDLLTRVGLKERLHYRPGQLSGGECQRVAVVRALINRPALLLADEPTGALDEANAAELSALLFDLQSTEALTMILVTHSPTLAGKAQRTLTLTDGHLS